MLPRPATAPFPAAQAGDVVLDRSLEHFVFAHGRAFDSYLATEPGRRHFVSSRRRGLVSYVSLGRHALVGGGLIAPEPHRDELLGEFVEHASRGRLRVAFHNVADDELPLFRRHGFQVTKWGEEPVVDLATLSWSGGRFEWLRRQVNHCRRHGVVVSEVRPGEIGHDEWAAAFAEVLEVAAESLARKAQADAMRFFEGRIDDHGLGHRRLFVARNEHGAGRIEGFLVCNPMLGGARWSTELYRHRLDSVRGTIPFLFHQAIGRLQAEGVERVDLCLDLGRGLDERLPGDSRLVRTGLRLITRHLGLLFDAAGLQHFKSRFRPRYENRYVCALPRASIGSLVAFARVTGGLLLDYRALPRILVERARRRTARETLPAAA